MAAVARPSPVRIICLQYGPVNISSQEQACVCAIKVI